MPVTRRSGGHFQRGRGQRVLSIRWRFKCCVKSGLNITANQKALNNFAIKDFDLVITVCDDANEECPVWLGKGKRVHEGFPRSSQSGGNGRGTAGRFPSSAGRNVKENSNPVKIINESDFVSLSFWIILTLHNAQSFGNRVIRENLG